MVATNGTENITYCMGIKKSTEGPLSGYEYQQNNPVTYDVDNFVPAAGHGSFLVDDDGNLVVFYTSVISYENGFDRRVRHGHLLRGRERRRRGSRESPTPRSFPPRWSKTPRRAAASAWPA